MQSYWRNPDLSNISLFGKDIRALLAISSQKIFFDNDHDGFYHYGPLETATRGGYYSSRTSLELAEAIYDQTMQNKKKMELIIIIKSGKQKTSQQENPKTWLQQMQKELCRQPSM